MKKDRPLIEWPLSDWIDNVALAVLTSKETVLATFDLARNCIERGIPGDFVECGVFSGAQCALMARAIMERGVHRTRRVHLFDCFEGIPEPGVHDTDILNREMYETFRHQTTCSLQDVKRNMAQWGIPDELLVYHPGMFQDTLRIEPAFPIALLRLDGDLYESVKVCIDILLPRVSVGGWVIIDDWGLKGARLAAMDSTVDAGPIYFKQPPKLS
jgi:O-methyltransferase